MTNNNLQQIYFRRTLITEPIDLSEAIQEIIDNPEKAPRKFNPPPQHMRGNVRLGDHGLTYNRTSEEDWQEVLNEAAGCYLKLRTINHDIPKLDLQGIIDPKMNLRVIQDLCIDAQKIWDEKPAGTVRVQEPEQKAEETLTSPTGEKWKPPRGYIGSQYIINSTIRELKERLGLPTQQHVEEYKIPRSTLEYWQKKDTVPGGKLEGNIKRDPTTNEVWYPNKWLKKHILKYEPRDRNS